MHRKFKERAMAMALAVVMTVSNIPMNSFAMEYEPAMEEQTDMNAEQYAEEPTAQDEYYEEPAQETYQEPAQEEYQEPVQQDDSAQEPEQQVEPAQEPVQEPAAAVEGTDLPDLDGSAGDAAPGEEMVDEEENLDGIQEEEVAGSNPDTVDSLDDISFEELVVDEDIVDDVTMDALMAEINPDTITGSTADEWLQNYAAAFFADTTNLPISVTVTPQFDAVNSTLPDQGNRPIVAGDTIKYDILCEFAAAPVVNPEVDGKEVYTRSLPLFNSYDNSKVEITLPAGLLLTGAGIYPNYVTSPNDKNPNTAHTYTIELDPSGERQAESSSRVTFTISVYVCNNGTDSSVETYTISSDNVTMSTDIEIVNQKHPDDSLAHYDQEDTDTCAGFETTTNDEWGVEKKIADGYPKLETVQGETVATFQWEIGVGIVNDALSTDDNIVVYKNDTEYNVAGRDAVSDLQLKDIFEAWFKTDPSATGTTLNPATQVTIQKIDKNGNPGDAVSYNSGSPITLQRANPTENERKLALNTVSIDINSDNTDNYKVDFPCYTKYLLKCSYRVTDEMIAKFSENKSYQIDSNNKVTLVEYTLADMGDYAGNSAQAVGSLPLPTTKPAQLTIENSSNRKLQCLMSNIRPLHMQPSIVP